VQLVHIGKLQTMNTTRVNSAISVGVFAMVAFNGIFLAANGLFMLVAPAVWYEFVPGVTDTGFFNQHFVRDIGIVSLPRHGVRNRHDPTAAPR
jgi:hypothetical protein